MDYFMNLLKEHEVGEWCKRAAWIIAAIGIVNIVLDSYSFIAQGGSGIQVSLIVAATIRATITNVSFIIFSFFILYAIGTLLNHFISDEQDEEDEEDEIPEKETPGQFQ